MLSGAKIRISEQNTKFIWIFSSVSIFGEARDTKKERMNALFFYFFLVCPKINVADDAQ